MTDKARPIPMGASLDEAAEWFTETMVEWRCGMVEQILLSDSKDWAIALFGDSE